MAGTLACQSIYFFTLAPPIFLLTRLGEGLAIGLFWPNLQSSISDNTLHDHSKIMSRYNMGWNTGLLAGYSVGAIFLFIIDIVELIFYVAPFLVLFSCAVALFLFQESQKIDLASSQQIREADTSRFQKRTDLQLTAYHIPALMWIWIIVVFAFSKGGISFLYPLKSEIVGLPSFTVYLLTLLSVVMQLIGTSSATYASLKNLKRLPLVCIAVLALALLLFGATTHYYIFLVLFLMAGFSAGLLYGFALKLSVSLNMKEHTSKYSGYLESLIGLTFLISPIICGILAIYGIDFVFFLLAGIMGLFLIPYLLAMRKFRAPSDQNPS